MPGKTTENSIEYAGVWFGLLAPQLNIFAAAATTAAKTSSWQPKVSTLPHTRAPTYIYVAVAAEKS